MPFDLSHLRHREVHSEVRGLDLSASNLRGCHHRPLRSWPDPGSSHRPRVEDHDPWGPRARGLSPPVTGRGHGRGQSIARSSISSPSDGLAGTRSLLLLLLIVEYICYVASQIKCLSTPPSYGGTAGQRMIIRRGSFKESWRCSLTDVP